MYEKRLKEILLSDGLMLLFDRNRLLFLLIIKAGDRAEKICLELKLPLLTEVQKTKANLQENCN